MEVKVHDALGAPQKDKDMTGAAGQGAGGQESLLAALRQEIDEIDSQLIALLCRRSDVSRRVGEAKNSSRVVFRPGREMQVIRRLIEESGGAFQQSTLVQLWREIFGASISRQAVFRVASEKGPDDLAALARSHFGVTAEVMAPVSAQRVLHKLETGEVSVGVLYPPRDADPAPWWRFLLRGPLSTLRIVGRVPMEAGGPVDAVMLVRDTPEPSGEDTSFIALETDGQVSRSTIKRTCEAHGLNVLFSAVWNEGESSLHLCEVDGYLAQQDMRLVALGNSLGSACLDLAVIGVCAVPLPRCTASPN